MKRVRCVSPHGGGHDGILHSGEWAPPGWAVGRPVDALAYPPNPGGYIDSAVLGRVAVGAEVDAPDDFTCDGWNFTDAEPPRGAAKAATAAEGE